MSAFHLLAVEYRTAALTLADLDLDAQTVADTLESMSGDLEVKAGSLAYVGHAALTDRLLDTDPAWTWEPLGVDDRGLPAIDECGGLWINLTVCGVTRLGYGDAGSKKGGDAMKERIGDALRNAAMRFGAALDLWHKGDLHAGKEAPPISDDDMVATLREAALNGTESLRAAYVALLPSEALWKAHKASLKAAAQAVDSQNIELETA